MLDKIALSTAKQNWSTALAALLQQKCGAIFNNRLSALELQTKAPWKWGGCNVTRPRLYFDYLLRTQFTWESVKLEYTLP